MVHLRHSTLIWGMNNFFRSPKLISLSRLRRASLHAGSGAGCGRLRRRPAGIGPRPGPPQRLRACAAPRASTRARHAERCSLPSDSVGNVGAASGRPRTGPPSSARRTRPPRRIAPLREVRAAVRVGRALGWPQQHDGAAVGRDSRAAHDRGRSAVLGRACARTCDAQRAGGGTRGGRTKAALSLGSAAHDVIDRSSTCTPPAASASPSTCTPTASGTRRKPRQPWPARSPRSVRGVVQTLR